MANSSSYTVDGTVKGRYERLKQDRFLFLDRARQCAELTIPTLIPPEGHTTSTKYYTPWQGLGARGVENLSAKLLLSLLPPNTPFFKLDVNDFAKAQMAGDPAFKSKIDEGLAKIERAVQQEIEGAGLRAPCFLAFKHLIVGGNVFLYLPPAAGIRVYPLDSYVVVRDTEGNLLEAITLERVHPEALPEDVEALLFDGESHSDADEEKEAKKEVPTKKDDLEVYTRFYRAGNRWRSYQEINGKTIPGSEGSWPLDKPPFMALRWTMVEGESYGRSFVESYLGDLIALEGLSKAQVQSAATAAKTVFLVNPNGVTRSKDLTEAEAGDFVVGAKDDVHALQIEKYHDLQVAEQAIQRITERLSYAFLLQSAIQRKGERVTAEEIRYMASELEDTYGGFYSLMSQEFQQPLVNRLMDRMTKDKKLPPLPKNVVKVQIVTGMEALGRGHDASRLEAFLGTVLQLEGAAQYINIPEALSRLATARGVDPAGLVKTPEQIAQEQQAAIQAQQNTMMGDIAGKAAPAAIKAMSDQALAQRQAEAQPN